MSEPAPDFSPPAFRRDFVKIVEQLAGTGSIEDVGSTLREKARRLLGADGIALVLRDGDQCHYVEEDAVSPLWKGKKFPMRDCVSGWAMLNKRTAVIPDISNDERVTPAYYAGTFVKSILMVPFGVEQPVGALGAYWSQPYEPSREEVDTLEVLASAAATGLENVNLISTLSRALGEAELARDELRHRVKNAYMATQGLASLTLPPEHSRAFNARVRALARAHELLDRKLATQTSITLTELINAELSPYETAEERRVSISGPPLQLASAQAVALGLAVNELATNALKYGALSTNTGNLTVSWSQQNDHLILTWQEKDGPGVHAAAIEGFGSRLLRRIVEGELQGTIARSLDRDGVACRIEFPLTLLHRDLSTVHSKQST